MASATKGRRRDRRARQLSQRRYALRQVRPTALRAGLPVALLLLGLAGGALGMRAWQVRSASAVEAPLATTATAATAPGDAGCTTTPGAVTPGVTAAAAAPGGVEAELERTRLALAQEKASRAAIQKSADASAAEAARLDTELKFLRGAANKPH